MSAASGGGPLPGYPLTAPPLRPPVLFDQFWGDITFVHWPVRPGDVAHLFLPGTRPDVYADGLTYVGLIPFQMREAALGRTRPVPYFGRFHETNVRLYSTDDAGRHGVLFRSLETQRLAVVPAARIAFGVPYTWARMRTTRVADRIRYESVRRWPRRGLRSVLEVRIGGELEPGGLDVWLTARWGAHTRVAGRTWWCRTSTCPGRCARRTSSSSPTTCWRRAASCPPGDRCARCSAPACGRASGARRWWPDQLPAGGGGGSL